MEYVECEQCGVECGSYTPAHISGPVEDCYPAEWEQEPEITEDDLGYEERYFCSIACQQEWHKEHDEVENED